MQLRRVLVALALTSGAAFAPTLRSHAKAIRATADAADDAKAKYEARRAAKATAVKDAVPIATADVECGECDPMSPFSDGCKPCADGRSVFVGDSKVTSKTLRDIDVVAPSGERVLLNDMMGSRASVVVFLRHLG